LHPQPSRRHGALCWLSYEVEWWSGGNAQSSLRQLLATLVLQTGSRNTSRASWWRQRELHPGISWGRYSTVKLHRKLKGARSDLRSLAMPFQQEQTPLASCDTNPRFHGGSFGVLGHTSCEALKM